MGTIQLNSHIGADGVLSLRLPLGKVDADTDVLVTIQPLSGHGEKPTKETSDWHRFVEETYGSCAGLGLKRHEQGNFEEREALE